MRACHPGKDEKNPSTAKNVRLLGGLTRTCRKKVRNREKTKVMGTIKKRKASLYSLGIRTYRSKSSYIDRGEGEEENRPQQSVRGVKRIVRRHRNEIIICRKTSL